MFGRSAAVARVTIENATNKLNTPHLMLQSPQTILIEYSGKPIYIQSIDAVSQS